MKARKNNRNEEIKQHEKRRKVEIEQGVSEAIMQAQKEGHNICHLLPTSIKCHLYCFVPSTFIENRHFNGHFAEVTVLPHSTVTWMNIAFYRKGQRCKRRSRVYN